MDNLRSNMAHKYNATWLPGMTPAFQLAIFTKSLTNTTGRYKLFTHIRTSESPDSNVIKTLIFFPDFLILCFAVPFRLCAQYTILKAKWRDSRIFYSSESANDNCVKYFSLCFENVLGFIVYSMFTYFAVFYTFRFRAKKINCHVTPAVQLAISILSLSTSTRF